MEKVVQKAIEEISHLSETDQENIGRRLLSHIEKLRQLRAEIDKGIRSLDAGEGREINIDELIQSLRMRHGAA